MEVRILDSKKVNVLWLISLLVIGIATAILGGASAFGLALPDAAVRILGIVDLIALPVLGYATVKKFKKSE